MTFAQFLRAWRIRFTDLHAENQSIRRGQVFFNCLNSRRPELASELAGDAEDPYYDDSKLPAAVRWVEERW